MNQNKNVDTSKEEVMVRMVYPCEDLLVSSLWYT